MGEYSLLVQEWYNFGHYASPDQYFDRLAALTHALNAYGSRITHEQRMRLLRAIALFCIRKGLLYAG